MAIAGFETSTSYCSVALKVDDAVFEDTRKVERLHNQLLLKMLDGLCHQAQIKPADIHLVTYGQGPGSFTGVRLAAAVCQAIAFANDVKVAPIRSSDGLAYRAFSKEPALKELQYLLVATHSRSDLYYYALYKTTSAVSQDHTFEFKKVGDDQLLESIKSFSALWATMVSADDSTALELSPALGAWQLVGARPPWLDLAGRSSSYVEGIYPSAVALLDVAADMAAKNQLVDAQQALPLYIRGDHPWKKQAQN